MTLVQVSVCVDAKITFLTTTGFQASCHLCEGVAMQLNWPTRRSNRRKESHTSTSKLGSSVSVSCVPASWPPLAAFAATTRDGSGGGGGPLCSVCVAPQAASSSSVSRSSRLSACRLACCRPCTGAGVRCGASGRRRTGISLAERGLSNDLQRGCSQKIEMLAQEHGATRSVLLLVCSSNALDKRWRRSETQGNLVIGMNIVHREDDLPAAGTRDSFEASKGAAPNTMSTACTLRRPCVQHAKFKSL